MAEPPFAVRFRPTTVEVTPVAEVERRTIYELALEFTSRVFAVIQLAEMERFYMKDHLDKGATLTALAIKQAMAEHNMPDRRALLRRARTAMTTCVSILDILAQRGTVEPEVLEPARDLAAMMVSDLVELTQAPLVVR